MTLKSIRLPILRFALSIAVVLKASMAAAQPADQNNAESSSSLTSPAWELEFHGAWTLVGGGLQGDGTLPATGVIDRGRLSASSLYFGSGASLFNANQSSLGSTALITALDPALQAAAARRESDAALGLRLQRRLTDHLSVEFTGEYTFSPLAFQPSTLTAIESARSSYQLALQDVLARSSSPSAVTSVSTVTDTPSANQLSTTGALVVHLTHGGRVRPYLTGGAGILFNSGTLPTATLTGTYSLGDLSRLLATDAVTLHFAQDAHSVIYLAGGGVNVGVTRRVGLRGDARVQMFRNSLVMLVDVAPARVLQSGGPAYPSLTAGTVQFDTLGPLNGKPFNSGQVFTGSGLEFHTVISVGLFVRF